eukprot:sb/3477212/
MNEPPLVNYVLVPFNDPDFYPMLVTNNGSILLRHLAMIDGHGASGGKDCPELTLAAVQRAITESYPGSEIFVFTDASKCLLGMKQIFRHPYSFPSNRHTNWGRGVERLGV